MSELQQRVIHVVANNVSNAIIVQIKAPIQYAGPQVLVESCLGPLGRIELAGKVWVSPAAEITS